MKSKISTNWYFILLIAFVLIVGIISTILIATQVKTNTEKSLLTRTNTIAQLLETDKIKSLEGSETDLNISNYQELKEQMKRTVSVNSDVRFIYLTGKRENEIFFYLDSEPSNSPDYSPPGQVYYEASKVFKDVFTTKRPIIEGINSDRWGTWISALTPIIDPQTNQVLSVVGMDIDAKDYIKTITVYSLLPALTTLFLLILISANHIMRRREIDRLILKAELVSIAGHEIRSPLSGVIWQLDDLLKNLTDKITESQFSTLKFVRDNCENLLKTTSDLLDLYALENAKQQARVEPVEISLLLKESAENFNLTVKEKNVQVVIKPCSKTWVLGDKYKLKRMLNNLLSNAIKYSKTDGRIEISCDENENSYLIKVIDNGIGIPLADQEKVFKGFYRAQNARQTMNEGTGLGLYYVKQIVRLHNGKIWFESKENTGTTFFVELPKYLKT